MARSTEYLSWLVGDGGDEWGGEIRVEPGVWMWHRQGAWIDRKGLGSILTLAHDVLARV